MVDKELEEKRAEIVINALISGLEIVYKHDWSIYYRNGELLQEHINPRTKEQVIHKSEITLGNFIKFVNDLSAKELKRLFVDTRLIHLQNKLIKRSLNE